MLAPPGAQSVRLRAGTRLGSRYRLCLAVDLHRRERPAGMRLNAQPQSARIGPRQLGSASGRLDCGDSQARHGRIFGSNFSGDMVYNNGPVVYPCCAGRTDVLVRAQRDVANLRYTLEVCDVVGGNCLSGTAQILTFGQPLLGRDDDQPQLLVTARRFCAGSHPWYRWARRFRSVGVAGDLGDWEFEGTSTIRAGTG